jgi:ketosteroid isomerase-like protein
VSDHANLRSARKAYDVEGAGDLPGFLELLTDDIDWRFFVSGIPGSESSVEGRRAVEKYLISLFGALEVQFFPAEFIADANSVLVLGSEHVRLRSSGGTFDANLGSCLHLSRRSNRPLSRIFGYHRSAGRQITIGSDRHCRI